MYIDGVIAFSLVVIVMIIAMMLYIGRYAKRHMNIDEQEAQASYNHTIAFTKEKAK
jgi:hypothetical protein